MLGPVAAGVIGSGALAVGASSHGKEQKVTKKLRKFQNIISSADNAAVKGKDVDVSKVNGDIHPDPTTIVTHGNSKGHVR